MTRYLPDEENLVRDVLGGTSSTQVPANLATKLPRHVVYKLSGVAVHQKFMDKPIVQVSSYAATRDDAKTLAEDARSALFLAWQSQHRYTNGVIHRVVEVASPFEVRTGTEPDGVSRFDATYQVFTRP